MTTIDELRNRILLPRRLLGIVPWTGIAVRAGAAPTPSPDLMLWYDRPAGAWRMEALPIGNGRLGDNCVKLPGTFRGDRALEAAVPGALSRPAVVPSTTPFGCRSTARLCSIIDSQETAAQPGRRQQAGLGNEEPKSVLPQGSEFQDSIDDQPSHGTAGTVGAWIDQIREGEGGRQRAGIVR